MKEKEKDCQRRAVLFWYLSVKIKVCQARIIRHNKQIDFLKIVRNDD